MYKLFFFFCFYFRCVPPFTGILRQSQYFHIDRNIPVGQALLSNQHWRSDMHIIAEIFFHKLFLEVFL